MLIKKLQTNPSPPKLSIFWSVPWPDEKYARDQVFEWLRETHAPVRGLRDKRLNADVEMWRRWLVEQDIQEHALEDAEGRLLNEAEIMKRLIVAYALKPIHYYAIYGLENNWAGARKIHYKDTDIRVFPDEFSVMTDEKMAMYTGLSEDASHLLIPSSVADATLIQEVLSGSLREVFDAAMVDGCTPEQARAMAFGVDTTDALASLPPIGWYRCRQDYAEFYCHEWEMKE
jgi:hypothetical protein